MFDATKTVNVAGTVVEFRWTNPHSWLLLDARDPSGKMVQYNIEMNGPGYLVRTGWKRESLKPGDAITVSINPMRDGSLGGNLLDVTLANGTQLSARPKIAGLAPPAGVQK